MEDIVYEDEIINKIFKGLDIETKNKLLKDFPYNENNKNIHVGILKNIADPKIKEIWKTLPEQKKQELDKKNIRDKYLFLREMVKDFKPTVITPLSSSESEPGSSLSLEVTPKEYWENKNMIKGSKLNDPSKYYSSLANKKSDSDIEGTVLTKIAIIIPFRDLEKEQKRTKQLNELVKFFEKNILVVGDTGSLINDPAPIKGLPL